MNKEARIQRIINYSLSFYMPEVDDLTKETFCFACPDRKYDCFPCPMSRNVGHQILPAVISKYAWMN